MFTFVHVILLPFLITGAVFAFIFFMLRVVDPWYQRKRELHCYDDPKPWWWYLF